MRTIDKIITKRNCQYGAPMGRSDVGVRPVDTRIDENGNTIEFDFMKVYDCYIPMSGGYDRGGAYWGLPDNVRVRYTKDLSYVEFYRPIIQ